jgi:hypothetical protein
MDIEVRYFDGCPNWSDAVGRLHQALAARGTVDDIRLTKVDSPERAASA